MSSSPPRPPFAYFGGKTSLAGQIAALLPPHRHYVEPFGGSLAVLLAKPPSPMETVNDLDHALVTFWRVLRQRPAELAWVCACSPHSRAEWQTCANLDTDEELETARRVWVRLSQTRTGRFLRCGWRHYVNPTGATAFPSYLDGYLQRLAPAAARLHHVSLECRPALELITRYGAHPDVQLYLDPPYLGSTRHHQRCYRHELATDDEHRELAAAAHGCQASVVLSGYPSPLYDRELYPHWQRVSFTTGTGQSATGWSPRTEVLWSNRALHTPTLFDHTTPDRAPSVAAAVTALMAGGA